MTDASTLAARLRRPRGYVPVLVLLFALVFPLFLLSSWVDLLVLTTLMAGLAGAWNLFGGYTGYFSLGHVVFFGVGAYTTSILFNQFGLPPLLTMVLGMAFAVAVGFVIGVATLDLDGHYFALASIAVVLIMETLATYFKGITGGSVGQQLTFDPGLLNLMFHNGVYHYYVALVYLLAVLAITRYVDRRKFGYYLKAIREDEDAAEMLGIDTNRVKHYSLALSAALSAVGGTIYGQYTLFVGPHTAFDLFRSIYFALYPLIGGLGTVVGPLVGTFLVDPISGVFSRTFGGSVATLTNMLYGAILIVVVVMFPNGIVGELRGSYHRFLDRLPTLGSIDEREGDVEVIDE